LDNLKKITNINRNDKIKLLIKTPAYKLFIKKKPEEETIKTT